jgi:ABC-type transport system substrate-binding protein
MIESAGPWGTGPYQLVEGFSVPGKRSDRVVLEANPHYWDRTRRPRVKRIVFDNTLSQQEAVELVKTTEGRVDLVSELRPLETLRVAESPWAGGEEPGESHHDVWPVQYAQSGEPVA